MSAAK